MKAELARRHQERMNSIESRSRHERVLSSPPIEPHREHAVVQLSSPLRTRVRSGERRSPTPQRSPVRPHNFRSSSMRGIRSPSRHIYGGEIQPY